MSRDTFNPNCITKSGPSPLFVSSSTN